MDEQDKQDKQPAEPETTTEPALETRAQLLRRWGGLVVCTLILIGCALLVTGLILYFSNRLGRGHKTARNATIGDALLVGVSQALATVPGLSRSGTTISCGLCCGFERSFAVKFSFFLSIPAVLGANLLQLIDAISTGINWALFPKYMAGVAAAMISGYLSIRFLKQLAEKKGLGSFAYYCWGVGAVTVILSLIK